MKEKGHFHQWVSDDIPNVASGKNLTRIDNQISQSAPCGKKLPDDYADETQSDIDFHIAYDCRNGTGENNLCQSVAFCSVQCVNQVEFFVINAGKTGIQIQNTSENRDRHSGDNDGGRGSAQPDNKQRGKGRFRQTVQDDEIRVKYLGKFSTVPEQNGGECADKGYECKTSKRFIKRRPNVQKDTSIQCHFVKTQGNPGRTAKNKRIYNADIGGKFPKEKKTQQNGNPKDNYNPVMFFTLVQIKLLSGGKFIHFDSTPSRFH